MKYIKGFIVIFIISLLALTAYATEETAKEKFPKTGYVKNDGAEVKAGDNMNFENLCTMSKSESVKIIDRRYSWFKILLPRKASVYVSKDYITITSDEKGIGIINATNVNLRAGAGTRYSIVGQISKPEKVSILSEEAGWCRIEPPYGAAGWVQSDQINVAEENEIKKSEAKPKERKEGTAARPSVSAAEAGKAGAAGSTVKLNANYPVPKGNLSISTSTKNNTR